jgi:hypothetical protein
MSYIPVILLLRLSGCLQSVVARLQVKAVLVVQALGWVIVRRSRCTHGMRIQNKVATKKSQVGK